MERIINNNGQNLLEYVLLIGVVLLIVFSMGPFVKRGTQGMIKTVADQIGEQVNADQLPYDQTGMSYRDMFGDGGLDSQVSSTKSIQNTRLIENAGDTTYQYSDSSETHSTTELGLGFAEE